MTPLSQNLAEQLQGVIVSFSGGKTSAYMAKRMIDRKYHANLRFVFMNTGCEEEETLRFIDRCDREWGIGVVWLEAEINPTKGIGTGHRVVSFATASRNGEPFEALIKKHGIPNVSHPHCTRDLKRRVMDSWMREALFGEWLVAIGIRADEPKRIRQEKRYIYPLFHDFPTTKPMINDWWEDQPFTLNLLPHRGNCIWCWKKSVAKLIRIAKETPEAFDFPRRMEAEYRNVGPEHEPNRVFFRECRSASDIIQISQSASYMRPMSLFDEDEDAGCSESCEVFA